MIAFITWKWGTKYGAEDVNRWARGVLRYSHLQARAYCVTDDPDGISPDVAIIHPAYFPDPEVVQRLLCYKDGCYARLFMFSDYFQGMMAAAGISHVICTDLDGVITGDLTTLAPLDGFAIAYGIHVINCRYNGSIVAWRIGKKRRLWHDFRLHVAEAVAWDPGSGPGEGKIYWGTDQSWYWHLREPSDVHLTPAQGIYGYMKPGWPPGGDLPANARAVFFPGARDPRNPQIQAASPWIVEHWR